MRASPSGAAGREGVGILESFRLPGAHPDFPHMLEMAERCPVHRTLQAEVLVETTLEESGPHIS